MHWKFWGLAIGCWPLLLWQGRRVRKQALRLPEACGDRAGTLGQGQKLRLLICGDSAAAGVGCTQQQQALAGQLVNRLAGQAEVRWQLHASTGLNSAELYQQLQDLPASTLDWVVVSIGVNDVTELCPARRYRARMNALLQLIEHRFDGPRVLLSAIPPMQHFGALPAPLNYWLGLKASALNQQLEQVLANWPKASLVNAPAVLERSLLAEDGFHPSPAGASHWAALVADAMVVSEPECK